MGERVQKTDRCISEQVAGLKDEYIDRSIFIRCINTETVSSIDW
jgi:hypothetical protein